MKYVLKVSYDGAHFAGYQCQPGQRTVQGELSAALSRALHEEIRLTCAGRTDKGVHARGQVVMFKSSTPTRTSDWLEAVNQSLAPSIQILQLANAPPGFHPLHSAISKTYSYCILGSATQSIPACWCLPAKLELHRMRQAAKIFRGEHDFTSFSYRAGENNVRHVYEIAVMPLQSESGQFFRIEFRGKGFLRKMVRLLTAGIVECGQGLCEATDLQSKLEKRDDAEAPHPAPPHGLCLESIQYDPDPFQAQCAE